MTSAIRGWLGHQEAVQELTLVENRLTWWYIVFGFDRYSMLDFEIVDFLQDGQTLSNGVDTNFLQAFMVQ